jgi:outer membrane protein TolC
MTYCWNITLLLCFISGVISAQDTSRFSLEKLCEMAVKNNHQLQITRLRVRENEEKVSEMSSKYFPQVSMNAGYLHMSDIPTIKASRGSLGILPLGGTLVPLPTQDLTIMQGEHDMSMASVMVVQPVTQVTKIKTGVEYAEKEVTIAKKESEKAELQIRQGVEKLYFGILIAQKQKQEITLKLVLAKARLADVENALTSGKTIEMSKTGLLATVADEEQNLLKINNQIEDYFADLRHLAGIPAGKEITVEDAVSATEPQQDVLLVYQKQAAERNHELLIARTKKEKASLGYTAAWKEYIPDIGIVAGYSYQPKIDYIPKNNLYAGVLLQWNVWDWGSRKKVMNQRELLEQQADENICNVREQLSNDVEKAYRKLKHAEELITVAEKVLTYRKADADFQANKQDSGMNLQVDQLAARAALAKAETELLSARVNYRLAATELKILTGTY